MSVRALTDASQLAGLIPATIALVGAVGGQGDAGHLHIAALLDVLHLDIGELPIELDEAFGFLQPEAAEGLVGQRDATGILTVGQLVGNLTHSQRGKPVLF